MPLVGKHELEVYKDILCSEDLKSIIESRYPGRSLIYHALGCKVCADVIRLEFPTFPDVEIPVTSEHWSG